MSVITFLFWLYVIRFFIYLIIMGVSEYPRKPKPVNLGADIGTVILTILICIWIGLVKYGVIGVGL